MDVKTKTLIKDIDSVEYMKNLMIILMISALLITGCTQATGQVVRIDTIEDEPVQENPVEVIEEVPEPVQEDEPEVVIEEAPIPDIANQLVKRTGVVARTDLGAFIIRVDGSYKDLRYYNRDIVLRLGDTVSFLEDNSGNIIDLVRTTDEAHRY